MKLLLMVLLLIILGLLMTLTISCGKIFDYSETPKLLEFTKSSGVGVNRILLITLHPPSFLGNYYYNDSYSIITEQNTKEYALSNQVYTIGVGAKDAKKINEQLYIIKTGGMTQAGTDLQSLLVLDKNTFSINKEILLTTTPFKMTNDLAKIYIANINNSLSIVDLTDFSIKNVDLNLPSIKNILYFDNKIYIIYDQTLTIINIETCKIEKSITLLNKADSITQYKNNLYISEDNGFIEVINTLTESSIAKISFNEEVNQIEITPEGKGFVIGAGNTRKILTFNADSYQINEPINLVGFRIDNFVSMTLDHQGQLWIVCNYVSPGFLGTSNIEFIYIADINTGQIKGPYKTNTTTEVILTL
ncbi:MAG: hypothetical protein WC860_08245 [Candidatus Margulisiibacteriota bacterium]|jgi:hypothetical protein